MAKFIPSKKTEKDFNDGEKYINKIDVVQAETANNLIEAVLYQQENALEENKIKIITEQDNYSYEKIKHTAKTPMPYPQQGIGVQQDIEVIITAGNNNELAVDDGNSIKLEFKSENRGGEVSPLPYTITSNYSSETGTVIFDDPIAYEEKGETNLKIVIHVKWNDTVLGGYTVSVDFTETVKTPLSPTDQQFLLNNNSELKFHNFDSLLENPNRLVIDNTRICAQSNPYLSGDITLKGGKNVTVEQEGKTITFNSENTSAILKGDITVYTDTAGAESHTFPLEKGSKLRFHGFDTELESENHLIIEGTRLKAQDYFSFTSGDIVLKAGSGIGISQVGNEITFEGYSAVTSVNGKTGTVVLSKYDFGLPDVAISGSYDDLTDKPDIPEVLVKSVNGKTGNVMITKYDLSLPEVALTGSYNDLTDVPTNLMTTDTAQNVPGKKTFLTDVTVQHPTTNARASLQYNSLTLGVGNKNASSSSPQKYLTVSPLGIYLSEDVGGASRNPLAFDFPSVSGTLATKEEVVTSVNGKSGNVMITKYDLSLPEVAISGNYGDLEGTPDFANVAFTGKFTDLTSPFTIPYDEVFMIGDIKNGYLQLSNSGFAKSGTNLSYVYSLPNKSGTIALTSDISWSNLSGKPSWIGSNKPTYSASDISGLATVAKTGSYNDLLNKPTDKQIGLAAHPVGSYYISNSSTSPATLFGGSWTSVTGSFLYCNAGTSTGGSSTVTLTVDNMPSHRHRVTDEDTGGWVGRGYGAGHSGYKVTGIESSGNVGGLWRTEYEGGGKSFSIMPPYKTVYAWRRTA